MCRWCRWWWWWWVWWQRPLLGSSPVSAAIFSFHVDTNPARSTAKRGHPAVWARFSMSEPPLPDVGGGVCGATAASGGVISVRSFFVNRSMTGELEYAGPSYKKATRNHGSSRRRIASVGGWAAAAVHGAPLRGWRHRRNRGSPSTPPKLLATRGRQQRAKQGETPQLILPRKLPNTYGEGHKTVTHRRKLNGHHEKTAIQKISFIMSVTG